MNSNIQNEEERICCFESKNVFWLLAFEIQTCMNRFNKWKLIIRKLISKLLLVENTKLWSQPKSNSHDAMLPCYLPIKVNQKKKETLICLWLILSLNSTSTLHPQTKNKKRENKRVGREEVYANTRSTVSFLISSRVMVPLSPAMFSCSAKTKEALQKTNKFSRQKGIEKIKGSLNENSVSQEKWVNEWKKR